MSVKTPEATSSDDENNEIKGVGTCLDDFIRLMPKVELHVHLEGTLEPDLLFRLAQSNHIPLKYETQDEVYQAYNFTSLEDFLQLYYDGIKVLLQESDFHDLAWAYLTRVQKENVRHCEVFFDPQSHMDRGVSFETVVTGFSRAMQAAFQQFDMTSQLIMCFERHLSVESMFQTLDASLPFQHMIAAVGLDSGPEIGNPPIKYKALFEKARAVGYECVAHAGEEGPAQFVADSLEYLKVRRIDHGVRAHDDVQVVKRLVKEQIPLTVCPISECKLCVFSSMKEHNIKKLIDAGVCVTINSDDPSYFGGYITDNFLAVVNEPTLQINREHVIAMVQNSIHAAMLDPKDKEKLFKELSDFCTSHPP